MDFSTEACSDTAQAMGIQQDLSSRSSWDGTVKPGVLVETPIYLFGRFVSALSSDTLEDIRCRPEFSMFVRDLCVKAPPMAQYLLEEILNHSRNDFQPEAQGPEERGSGPNSKRRSKRKKPLDRTYRLPKSSRTQPDIPRDQAEDSVTAVEGSSLISDDLVTSQHGHENIIINQSSETEKPQTVQGCEGDTPEIIVRDFSQEGVQSQVTCQPVHDDRAINQSRDSLTAEKPQSVQGCEGDIPETVAENHAREGVQGQSAAHIDSEPARHPLVATYGSAMVDTAHRQPSALAPDESNVPPYSPSPSKAEQRKTALPEIDGKASDAQVPSGPSLSHGIDPREPTLSGRTLSTPVRQICRGIQSPLSDDQIVTPNPALFTPTFNGEVLSPLTDDDLPSPPLGKVEVTLLEGISSSLSSTGQQQIRSCNTASTQTQRVNGEQPLLIQDCQTMQPSSLLGEAPTLVNMVAKAVHLIYKMSRRQEVPTKIHSVILSALQPSLGDPQTSTAMAEVKDSMWNTSSSTSWSASMWISMLEAGQAHSREATILNMIEWIGASKWYDAELIRAEKTPPLTKRGRLRKRLATIVLDEYLKEAQDNSAVESPGKLALGNNEDRSQFVDSAGIQKRILDARRKKLNNIFHRGRTLRKLVQMTHLGILLDADIWSYAKMSKEKIDKVTASFQADPQKMELLSILDEQVELLISTGRPDLSRFLDSLESHSITGSEDVLSLRAEYGLERVSKYLEPVPQGCLDTKFDRVVEGIGHVLGKYTLDDDDVVMVNGTIELSCGVFNRLRSREWLNCWDIAVALEMVDRPPCVKIGLSIPLYKKSANGDVTPISNPLRRWRKTIDDHRREGKNDSDGLLVYFCPLNVHANHFTLLEINEQTKMIYHYDSMASRKVIHHKTKSTLVRREIEKEFKHLNFGYTEEPTSQQKDGWSCGLMVIRNAKRRMIGLPVGSWDDKVDPERVIKEVVGDFWTFLENDTLQPSPLSRKPNFKILAEQYGKNPQLHISTTLMTSLGDTSVDRPRVERWLGKCLTDVHVVGLAKNQSEPGTSIEYVLARSTDGSIPTQWWCKKQLQHRFVDFNTENSWRDFDDKFENYKFRTGQISEDSMHEMERYSQFYQYQQERENC